MSIVYSCGNYIIIITISSSSSKNVSK